MLRRKLILLCAVISLFMCTGCSKYQNANKIAHVFDKIVNTEKSEHIEKIGDGKYHIMSIDVNFGIYSTGINERKLIQSIFGIEIIEENNKILTLYLTDEEYECMLDTLNNYKVQGIENIEDGIMITENKFNGQFNEHISTALIINQINHRISNTTWDVYIYGNNKTTPMLHYGDDVKNHLCKQN